MWQSLTILDVCLRNLPRKQRFAWQPTESKLIFLNLWDRHRSFPSLCVIWDAFPELTSQQATIRRNTTDIKFTGKTAHRSHHLMTQESWMKWRKWQITTTFWRWTRMRQKQQIFMKWSAKKLTMLILQSWKNRFYIWMPSRKKAKTWKSYILLFTEQEISLQEESSKSLDSKMFMW